MGEIEADSDGTPYCQCNASRQLLLKVRASCNTAGPVEVTFERLAQEYHIAPVGSAGYSPVSTERLEDYPSDLVYLDATLSGRCTPSGDAVYGGYMCRLPGTCR